LFQSLVVHYNLEIDGLHIQYTMDALADLNLFELPEQQTKISSKVSKALKENPDIRLGFDHCCTCATPLTLSDKSDKTCKACKRVWYCSKECRRQDGEAVLNDEDQASGHSAVMCHLLRLCEIDELVEDPKSTHQSISKEDKKASIDRINSEFESYPATLNVLMDAPCFQPVLTCPKEQKQCPSNGLEDKEGKLRTLTIHIIGATEEAELWGDFKLSHESCRNAGDAYSEALAELASTYSSIHTINLIFVGPSCPEKNRHDVKIIQKGNLNVDGKKRKREDTCELILQTHQSDYDTASLKELPKPDFYVFFNPGFTCPDYNWSIALDVCIQQNLSRRVPFLVTTNTEMEAISDLQYLHQRGYIDDLPATVADIVQDGILEHDKDIVDYNDKHDMFFGENPNSGARVRQSGNMANDLFVKNRWIYGGLFSVITSEAGSNVKKINASSSPKKMKKQNNVQDSKVKTKKKKIIKKNKNSALM